MTNAVNGFVLLGSVDDGLEVHDVVQRSAGPVVLSSKQLLFKLSVRGSDVTLFASPLVNSSHASPSRLGLRGRSIESVIVKFLILHPTMSTNGSEILRGGTIGQSSSTLAKDLDRGVLVTSVGHFVRTQRSNVGAMVSKDA